MNFQYLLNDLKLRFTKGNSIVTKLILINVFVFVFFGILKLGFFIAGYDNAELINSGFFKIHSFFAIPDDFGSFLHKPWTLITYMFMHATLGHIFMNMLIFYWFANIMQDLYGNEKVLSTYILGGISGGILYLLAYQFLPVLADKGTYWGMVGASASIVAIIVATATLRPDYSLNLLFIGRVKIVYIALASILIYLISLPNGNYGGQIAHLGGALFGFMYATQLKKGNDIGEWLNKFLFSIQEAFKPQAKAKSKTRFKTYKGGATQNKGAKQAAGKSKNDQHEIDHILDKIAKSGYESLSEKEKNTLFNASKQ